MPKTETKGELSAQMLLEDLAEVLKAMERAPAWINKHLVAKMEGFYASANFGSGDRDPEIGLMPALEEAEVILAVRNFISPAMSHGDLESADLRFHGK